MKIIRRIKNLFRRRAGKYEVWDTSALSNHFELFKQTLQKEDVTLVIPEGVSHEISAGRRKNDRCKEIYKFIEGNVRNPKLIVEVTPDAIRGWTVDEQVIYTAQHYYNMGYDTTFITCDRDQSFRANLKRVAVKLIPVPVSKNDTEQSITEKSVVNSENVPVVVPVNTSVQEKEVQEEVQEELELSAKMIGKQCLLPFNRQFTVFDCKGKRKIPNQQGVVVELYDVVEYNNYSYIVNKITNNVVTLKMCSSFN